MTLHRFIRFWWLVGVAVVAFIGPAAGVAASPGSEGGLVVDQTPNPGVYGNIIWGISALRANDVWAVGVKATDTSNDTLAIHWNGTSWTAVPTPNPDAQCQDGDIMWTGQELSGVSGVSPTDVWAVGGGCYGINPLIEHWDGAAWSIVASPPLRVEGGSAWGSLGDVEAISSSNVWAVGYASSNGIEPLLEHWGGGSPNPSTASSARNELRSVAAVSPNDVWAVGMYENEQTSFHQHRTLVLHWDGVQWDIVASPQPGRTSQLTAATAIRRTPTPTPGTTSSGRSLFAAGVFSRYDRNIYDGHYTLPETLVMHR